jgi:hypothetical protein
MIEPGTVTVEGRLVRYLRRGVKEELLSILWDFQVQLENTLDVQAVLAILACFDAARSLFEWAGFVDESEPADLILDLARWPGLVLRVFETQYTREVWRLQDAAAGDYVLPTRDVPALGCLVAEICQKTGARPRSRRDDRSFLQKQLAKRRNRRRRGDR